MLQQHTGFPLLGVVAYFSSSSNDEDKDDNNGDVFVDGNIVGWQMEWRSECVRVSDVSPATTKDETPRLSNVCHRNWGGDDNDGKEADYDDGAQLDGNSPSADAAAAATAAAAAVFSTIL